MPAISIVAPVYGVEKYIHQFLDSIKNQTFQDLEVILVDDGSKDGCPAILDAFAEQDGRYRVIHQKNGGVSKARNTGLEQVSGKYVYIVDSDDWLEPTALESLWKAVERTGADIIYGDWVREMEGGSERLHCFSRPFETTDADSIEKLQYSVTSNNYTTNLRSKDFDRILHMGGAPWRMLIKTEIIQKNHLRFDPYVRGLGDDVLFSLHVYEYVHKAAYIQEVIYHYRILNASYSHGFKADYPEMVGRIYERIEAFLNKYNKGELIWQSYYMRALIYLQQGMKRYFQNTGNPNSEKQRYSEFIETLKTEPYKSAVKKTRLAHIGSKRMWVTTLLLKLHLHRLYWVVSGK